MSSSRLCINRLRRRRAHTALALLLAAALPRAASPQTIGQALRASLSSPLAHSPCVRLLSASGDAGCSTPQSGASGLLLAPADAPALAALLSGGPPARAAAAGAFVALPPALLTQPSLAALARRAWAAGVLALADGPAPPTGWSPAAPAPGAGAGARAWNAGGADLVRARWPFPVLALDAAGSAAVRVKAAANAAADAAGAGGTRAAVFSYYAMGPAGLTTAACAPAGTCAPLGGQSVWGVLGGAPPSPARPLLLAATGLDAGALFHDLAVGATAAGGSLAALLGAADALGREPSAAGLPLQLAFAAFQGDNAWGRLGSRRWLAEVRAFTCAAPAAAPATGGGAPAACAAPARADLSFTALSAAPLAGVLALDGLAPAPAPGGDGGGLFIHAGGAVSSSGRARGAAFAAAFAAGGGAAAPGGAPDGTLPPTPLDSFDEGGGWPGPPARVSWAAPPAPAGGAPPPALPVAVLAGYNDSYALPRVRGGRFDNASRVDAARAVAASTALARALYALATNVSDAAAAAAAVPPALAANATLVRALLECFTANAACALFAALFNLAPDGLLAAGVAAGPPTLYPGPYNPAVSDGAGGVQLYPSLIETVTRQALALALSPANGTAAPACALPAAGGAAPPPPPAGVACAPPWECIAGSCILSSAHFHDAYSLAVEPAPGGYAFNASAAAALARGARPDAEGDAVWAEPFWSPGVGAWEFAQEDPAFEAALAAVGVLATAAAGGAALVLGRWIDAQWSGKAA